MCTKLLRSFGHSPDCMYVWTTKSLQTFCSISQYFKVRWSLCDYTSQDPPHHSPRMSWDVDDVSNTRQTQKFRRRENQHRRAIHIEDTYEDVKRILADQGQCWCAVHKNTWSQQPNLYVTSCLCLLHKTSPECSCVVGCLSGEPPTFCMCKRQLP